MLTIMKILQPLLLIAVAVGILRFILSVAHAPRVVVYLASLTAIELLGMLYLTFKVGRSHDVGMLHLWAGNAILFGVCQALYLAGIAYTALSGTPTLYHETERLRNFLGYEPSLWKHAGMHVLNWMIIAPTLATWVIGAPVVWLLRRK